MLRGIIILISFCISVNSFSQLSISPFAGAHFSFTSYLDYDGEGEWTSNNLALQLGAAVNDQFRVWTSVMQMNNVAFDSKSSNNKVLLNNYGVSYRFLPTEKIASGVVEMSGGFGLGSNLENEDINQTYTKLDTSDNYYVYNGNFKKYKNLFRLGFKADIYWKGLELLVGPTYGASYIGRSFTDPETGETTEFNDLVRGWNIEFTLLYRFNKKKAKSEGDDENSEDESALRL